MSKAADAVRETGTSLRTVFANPNLRRLNLAFAGSDVGDWAYATAILIWAYEVGGVRAVGLWYTIRLILLTIVTPFASTLVDRMSRRRLMITTDLVRAAICLVVAGLIWADAPPMSVFVLATIASLVSAPFRPAVASWLPRLVRTPEELTAANGTISTIDSLAFFVGPAIGGLLVGAFGVPVVVILNALTFLWSALLVSRIRTVGPVEELVGDAADEGGDPAGEGDDAEPSAEESSADDETQGFLSESMEGFRTLWRHPDLRLISGVYCAQTVVAGASAVFGVEMAVQMTPFGVNGVGYLDSAMGVGAIIGGFVAIGRATAGRLGTDFGIGVVFWALPLLLTAVWPQLWAAFLAMFIIGVANSVVDVNAATILQRSADESVLGRAFGALDTALIGSMAIGSMAMPLLIESVGLQWSLAILGLMVSAAILPAFGRLRVLDGRLGEPEGLALLRALPIFAPLDPKSLESIAGQLVRVPVAAGEPVIREGEEGDRFYVIESGTLTATFKGEVLSHMGPGDPFGEIALLRDVPRTATVVADEDSVLLALERHSFLDAVTGNTEVTMRADDLVSRRIPTY